MKRIGFIGYGLRSATMLKAFKSLNADIRVGAVADPRYETLRESLKEDPWFRDALFCSDGESLLENRDLDGVFIGTRCSLHAQWAIKALERDLPVFLEKPVAISRSQYEGLRDASKDKASRVVVSFPLRHSDICLEMKHIVESGDLGDITQVQAVNNVPYGSVYYHSWYRDPEETGGLFLQKATHDLDYICFLLDAKPVEVCAVKAKLYFKGDKPPGLLCRDCGDYYTCVESGYTVKHLLKEKVTGEMCCFAQDTGNEDTASAIITYENGVHACYSQNFITKKSGARRGARLLCTKGAAEFDWYSGEIRVDRYRTSQTVLHRFQAREGSHFGGDEKLALDFIRVMEGHPAKSDLNAGLISALTCMAARESAETRHFVPVVY